MKCPFCSKENIEGTIKCQCGYQFEGYQEPEIHNIKSVQNQGEIKCLECGKTISSFDKQYFLYGKLVCFDCFEKLKSTAKSIDKKSMSGIWRDQGFWSFDKMITISIIPFIFKISVALDLVAALIVLIIIPSGMSSVNSDMLPVGIILGILGALILFFICFFIQRLSFEIMIVLFKIWENTKYLRPK